ncbi:MAG: iron chelate uptake ABC transporter family permease subunit [Spirochaetaceae bacterium]|nr:iron chelate uptake ABC transporter family permease subunit [Spirochaetaceae bacterium]MBR6565881.1 iron chelate uptake ABC transporter family permease subunit [Spirochaetaceae bacterium]
MEEQTTSPLQEESKSKSRLTLQNRILSLGRATEIHPVDGEKDVVLEAIVPVVGDVSKNHHLKKTLSFSQKRLLAGRRKLAALGCVALAAILAYLLVGVNFGNERLFNFAMKIRFPKVLAMVIAATAVGGASIVFQSVINNTIVTPCLLGMNSLYTLIHTGVVFVAGSASILATNSNLSFAVDLTVMAVVATLLYSFLFKKTGHNVLYVLLIGTVLTSFFGSIQSTMVRVMDPNEYDNLLSSLVASFSNVNGEIILFSVIVLIAVVFFLRRDLALLDVLTLGKHQAINLGLDYDASVRRLLLGVSLCIATATAMVGPISFLGLIIANLARQLMKTFRHTHLVLASALLGVVVLVGGQLIVEHLFSYSVPISVFITFGGGLYFLYLLMKKKRG